MGQYFKAPVVSFESMVRPSGPVQLVSAQSTDDCGSTCGDCMLLSISLGASSTCALAVSIHMERRPHWR